MTEVSSDLAPERASVEVIKRGETSLTMSLIRSAGGLTVNVKAHPSVEAFMRGLGTGEHVDVKATGPYWRPIRKDGPPLYVYSQTIPIPIDSLVLDSGDTVNVSRPGHNLIEPGSQREDGQMVLGRSRSTINLSFLRLVGISEDAGVTFCVRGVHTYEALTQMREKIGEAYKRFYRTYMKPIKMDIVVSTQETSL